MSQKFSTVPVLGAVLLILTAVLLVQQPSLGIQAQNKASSSLYISDPSFASLTAYQEDSADTAEVVHEEDEPEAPQIVAAISYQRPEPENVEVASQPAPYNAEQLIRSYAAEYGADPEIMLIIAACESNFRADAVNGPYGGMYQFLATTWKSNRRAMGLSDDPSLRFSAEEAVKTAAFKMARDGYGAWPACFKKAQLQLAVAN